MWQRHTEASSAAHHVLGAAGLVVGRKVLLQVAALQGPATAEDTGAATTAAVAVATVARHHPSKIWWSEHHRLLSVAGSTK